MIGQLWANTQVNYILELVVACAVLTRPLKKRSHFPLRLCLSMLGSLLFWCGMILFTPLGTWVDPGSGQLALQSLGYTLCFLGTSLPIFLICCRTDPLNAISYAACAYAMQHVAYVAVVTIYALTRHRPGILIELLAMILVYGLLQLLILRSMPHHDRLERGQGVSLISSVLIIFAVVVLSLATNPLFTQATEMFVIGQIYSFICCVFFLWMQVSYRRAMASQHESDVRTVRTEASHRQQRNETAAYRHMISMRRALRDMLSDALGEEKAWILDRFDQISERYTGELSPHSEILNIILQEKKLRTAGKVEWTCACDAQKMTFLDVNDVYIILENALDNAIECVMGYEEPEKRMIDVQIFSRKALLSIRVDNYCDQVLQFDGELPVTTRDSLLRGYGLELIRDTIAQYDGEMRVVYENRVFSLQIVIPIPAK